MPDRIESVRGGGAVPAALQMWFVLHFAVDMIVALPLFFAPSEVLGFLGWHSVDPLATRITAAAFFGIGLESLLGRNSDRKAFKGMLQLKLIWSAFSTVGIAWSVLEGSLKYPWVGWVLAAVFAAFHALWWYWLIQLRGREVVENT